jgi:hypothetical protein
VQFLPVYGYASGTGTGCGGGSQGADPGASVDQKLFWGLESCTSADLSGTLTSNCPGRSSTSTCQAYFYIDLALNACQGGASSVWDYAANAGSNENSFRHIAAGPISNAARLTARQETKCGKRGGSDSIAYFMDLGNAAMENFIYQNVWSSKSHFPTGWYPFSDDVGISYMPSVINSAEYRGAYSWQVGTGPYNVGTSWLTAVARYVNAACQAICLHQIMNSLGGAVLPCATIVSGHCYGSQKYAQGVYDNTIRLDQLCAGLNSANLDALVSERLINGNGSPGPIFNPYQIALFVNTAADILNNHTADRCSSVKFIDFDLPSQGQNIRDDQSAVKWLICARDGMPDFDIPWRVTYGRTAREVPLLPEDAIVPYGCESPLSAYRFNGSVVEQGTGCEKAGDSGGAVGLVVACPSKTEPVYGQQYQGCWLAGVNQGPCAVLMNTSAHPVTIIASMFPHDPAGSYHYLIGWNGAEATSFTFSSGTLRIAACSNPTYCNGTLQLHATPLVIGASQIPPRDSVFLIQ